MSTTSHLLSHPTLNCTLRGKSFDTVTQYRNLKYASIPGRWKDSVPLNALPIAQDGIYDATRFGPSCPQKRGAQAWDLTLAGDEVLECEEGQGASEKFDEFECLHVTVSVPKSLPKVRKEGAQRDEKLLPVFVWVHGGGLSMGSNSWPQYELRRFVERSIEIGKPVIGVSINYRVGILGFLVSEEVGTTGNYGFKDQVNALRWIRRHVRGFGGDPENVTASAESAGAISLSTLLCAETGDEGLFDRVVIMSGEATLRRPRGRRWQEEMYRDQLKILVLDDLEKEERVKKLRKMSTEEMLEKLPLAQHWCAFVDGIWMKERVGLSVLADGQMEVHKKRWCKEFVTGDTAHDGTILKARILDNPNAVRLLHALCEKGMLSSSEMQNLLSAYHLHSSSDPNHQKAGILLLASELRFYLPSLLTHRGWLSSLPKRPSHRYHFHVPNPFRGSFSGLASHELDVTFLLQNFNHLLSEEHRQIAEQMADQWISFANGEGWAEEGQITVFTKAGREIVGANEYDTKYRGERGRVLLDIKGEKLWSLAEAWQQVREDPKIDVNRDRERL